jgi:hypothetical protein
MVARGFELVFMAPDRFDFYCRAARCERVEDRPLAATIDAEVRGAVDIVAGVGGTLDGSAGFRCEGWVLGPRYDSLATLPLVAFLDQDRVCLAAFRAVRRYRPDLPAELGGTRSSFAGYVLTVPREQLPAGVRFLRLGVGSRDGARWSPEVVAMDRFAKPHHDLRSVRAEPTVLRVVDPRRPVRVAVLGRHADGSEHDLTQSPQTGFSVRDSEVARVSPTAELAALRRGRTELVVRHGEHEVAVVVEAAWPDLIDAEDAEAGTAGIAPRLQVLVEPGDGHGRGLRFRCEGGPVGTRGSLAIAAHPIAAVAPGSPETQGVSWQPLAVGPDGIAVGSVPVPPADLGGVPFYLRIVFRAADSDRVVAASNTVILTFG